MPAFRRRTVFAAPLIISLAGGCKDDGPGRTNNPPGPEEINKPPPAAPLEIMWDVRRVGPGACEATTVDTCPPTSKCNPPPPRASQCPPGTSDQSVIRVAQLVEGSCAIVPKGCEERSCVGVAAPCPLPHGQKLPE